MIYAQWGIKEKLINSMDPWLCFHCNDCQDMCPREAKPGDVMAAIRNMIIANVSVPSIIGKATQTLSGSLILLLIPIILLAIVILGINGGLGKRQSDDRVVNTIDVKDLDAIVEQVKEQGGTIITEKMPISGLGWFAQFKDPEGNVLGLMQDDPSAK